MNKLFSVTLYFNSDNNEKLHLETGYVTDYEELKHFYKKTTSGNLDNNISDDKLNNLISDSHGTICIINCLTNSSVKKYIQNSDNITKLMSIRYPDISDKTIKFNLIINNQVYNIPKWDVIHKNEINKYYHKVENIKFAKNPTDDNDLLVYWPIKEQWFTIPNEIKSLNKPTKLGFYKENGDPIFNIWVGKEPDNFLLANYEFNMINEEIRQVEINFYKDTRYEGNSNYMMQGNFIFRNDVLKSIPSATHSRKKSIANSSRTYGDVYTRGKLSIKSTDNNKYIDETYFAHKEDKTNDDEPVSYAIRAFLKHIKPELAKIVEYTKFNETKADKKNIIDDEYNDLAALKKKSTIISTPPSTPPSTPEAKLQTEYNDNNEVIEVQPVMNNQNNDNNNDNNLANDNNKPKKNGNETDEEAVTDLATPSQEPSSTLVIATGETETSGNIRISFTSSQKQIILERQDYRCNGIGRTDGPVYGNDWGVTAEELTNRVEVPVNYCCPLYRNGGDGKLTRMRSATSGGYIAQYDHIKECQYGGTNDIENGQALCYECHFLKTQIRKNNSSII
tara:strand:- start:509 stop:2197 length:1689 start_codon:yes stop_codon:yes gene_type:complete